MPLFKTGKKTDIKSDLQRCKIQLHLQMSLRASGTGIFNFCICFRTCLLTLFPCLCMVMTDTSTKTRILVDRDQISAFVVNPLQIFYGNLC